MSMVSVVGAYNSKFGSFVKRDKETKEVTDLKSIYELFIEAGRGALIDCNMQASEIDAVYVASFTPGLFTNQEHMGALSSLIDEGLRFKPATRCEAACASGSVAFYNAMYAIESGRIKTALVIGVEKMNLLDTKGVTNALASASYWVDEGLHGVTFPALFSEYAKGYKTHYNISDLDFQKYLASAAALCYRNGVKNSLAHFGAGGVSDRLQLFSAEAICNLPSDKNPMIADPLRLHDCSLVTDGSAALVLASADIAKGLKNKTRIKGIGHTNEHISIKNRENLHELIAGKKAVSLALKEANLSINDIDMVELHDCFTINQLLSTEALGLSKDGEAGIDYASGRFTKDDGKCAVNLSGGLKAKGHPVGATGVSMLALLYKQLTGNPIGETITWKKPENAMAFNIGGSAVTNCVSILGLE